MADIVSVTLFSGCGPDFVELKMCTNADNYLVKCFCVFVRFFFFFFPFFFYNEKQAKARYVMDNRKCEIKLSLLMCNHTSLQYRAN